LRIVRSSRRGGKLKSENPTTVVPDKRAFAADRAATEQVRMRDPYKRAVVGATGAEPQNPGQAFIKFAAKARVSFSCENRFDASKWRACELGSPIIPAPLLVSGRIAMPARQAPGWLIDAEI
jgi:hypothetical protein